MLRVVRQIDRRIYYLPEGGGAPVDLCPESYELEGGIEVHGIAGRWLDYDEREYTPVRMGSELVGFNQRVATSDTSPYGEYLKRIGGGRVPPELIPEGGSEDGIYRECLRHGITWEELLSSYTDGDTITRVLWEP